jgi:hypothetical protein
MPKRSSKPKAAVASTNQEAAAEHIDTEQQQAPESDLSPGASNGKNPAAVALGKLGGKKGGPARAAKLSKEQRAEIAKKAAQARWGKKAEKSR